MADTVKVYEFIAGQLQRMKNCEDKPNHQHNWEDAKSRIDLCVKECLPSGSGIDNGCEISFYDAKFDSHNRLRSFDITMSFHHMNDVGYYDGWTSHTIRVRPDWDGIDIAISGRDRNQIKEYLGETFHYALTRDINRHTLAVVETV